MSDVSVPARRLRTRPVRDGRDGLQVPGGHPGGQDAPEHLGALIRDLRLALGWSQGRLAGELRRIAAYEAVTRECVSRWENGKRLPGPFWLPHLADALQVPLRELERARMRRRDMLRLSGTVIAAAGAATAIRAAGHDLFDTIAAGDAGPLGIIQTAHETDVVLAGLSARDRPSMLHLARWADDGGSAVLRVNAAGILAKTPDLDAAGAAVGALRRDAGVRARYLSAVSARLARTARPASAELFNPGDAGARWCSAWLLAQDGTAQARRALARALRTEPVAEVVRTVGLILNGDSPCT
jgi:transcriptional regulator with XRE-family HTH domain